MGGNRTYDFGNFPVELKLPQDYTLTVNKGTYRTGTGADAVSSEDTAGVRFGLYSADDAELATCEIEASNLGECVFPTTALLADETVYIRELDAVPGSDAATKLASPLASFTTGTANNFTSRDYQIVYTVPDNAGSYTVPAHTTTNVWNAHSGYIANQVKNPVLAQSCSTGVKVGIVLDTSGSVSGYQNTLAQATTALVNGLTGTQSSVAMFSFDNTTPGKVSNHPALQSVETAAGATTVKRWYSTSASNGQTANFQPSGGTNWDAGLWEAAEGSAAYAYDVVFVLTDGNPTYSNNGNNTAGSGSLTSFRELERAVFSANAIKKTGARVITVGIGTGLSNDNLASISGQAGYVAGAGLNEFDYIKADWAQLQQVMEQFAQGLKCESTVTVEKQAKPYGGQFAAAQGWQFDLTQQGASSQIPAASAQSTGQNGQASWTLKFDEPGDVASLVLKEKEDRPGWSLTDLTCTPDDAEIDLGEKTAALSEVGIGENVKCIFKNEEYQAAALNIKKAFDDSVPSGAGNEATFNGAYTCTLNGGTVASGAWSSLGTGNATLVPDPGMPAADDIPVGASCSATEEAPTGSVGLPNSSWQWSSTPDISPGVTIVNGEEKTITVTNKADRVHGAFEVTKVVPAGSTADETNKYGGDWSCSLGAETKTGTWGPIAAGETWTSTAATEIPLGAECTVTNEERPDAPVADNPSFEWDGDPLFSDPVTAKQDDLGTITVTNTTKQVLGSVIWTKIASGTENELLAGSTWTLTGPGVPAGTVVTDCVAAPCAAGDYKDQDPDAGAFLLMNLPAGDYTLTEKTAPPGYQLVKDPINFTVVGGSTIELDPIENDQQDGVTLPLTGGLGRDAFLIGGTLLLLTAAGAVVVRQRRLHHVQQG